jgi:hypothetical protein
MEIEKTTAPTWHVVATDRDCPPRRLSQTRQFDPDGGRRFFVIDATRQTRSTNSLRVDQCCVASSCKPDDNMGPHLTWDDTAWVRDQWGASLVIKGVLDPEDAAEAVAGADGVVSNHGGRQLDGAPAALDALPAVAPRVGGKVQILLDGRYLPWQ